MQKNHNRGVANYIGNNKMIELENKLEESLPQQVRRIREFVRLNNLS
jgi:hypothetical protein